MRRIPILRARSRNAPAGSDALELLTVLPDLSPPLPPIRDLVDYIVLEVKVQEMAALFKQKASLKPVNVR